MKQSADIDILWGGYYASQEEGRSAFSVFRLLDFNRDAYHAALFDEQFSDISSLGEIRALAPFVGHVPVDARGLFDAPIQLPGGAPLRVKIWRAIWSTSNTTTYQPRNEAS